tara:strand:- start:449 stop:880 length:432 start_codon:yes stop_codon:yes gene_type:complete
MTDDRKGGGVSTRAEADLDALFAQARTEAHGEQMALPEALSARILADADSVLAEQAAQTQVRRARQAPVRSGFWRQLLTSIGGTPALAGLAVATVAGIWVGIVPPAGLQTGLQTVMGTTGTDDLFDIYFVDSSDVFEFAQSEG